MTLKFIALGEIMETIDAKGFLNHGSNLQLGMSVSSVFRAFPKGINLESNVMRDHRENIITKTLEPLRKDCEGISLSITLPKVERLILKLENNQVTYNQLEQECRDILERLRDELGTHIFFMIENKFATYYTEFDSGWENIIDRFPSVSNDIEEASKCIALERWIAAVFHLSRIAENTLVSIANNIGYKSNKPGFGEVLNYMDSQLEKARKDRNNALPEFVGNIQFLSAVTIQMHAVNRAWRQRVSHLDTKYTQEEALRIWSATKGLMEELATKWNEGNIPKG